MALRDRQMLEASGEPLPGPGAPVVQRLPIPWFCYALMTACVGMFLAEHLLPTFRTPIVIDGVERTALQVLALFGPLVRDGEWWRMVGMVLEHGGILHLVLNMSVVWTLGLALERSIGTWRFALISLITALGASIVVLAFAWWSPTVGASGMILGWAGAMIPISTATGRRSLWVWLLQVAAISFIFPNVSWQGHLGGFLFGLPCGLALRFGGGVFRNVAPILLFLTAILAVWVGMGHHPVPE